MKRRLTERRRTVPISGGGRRAPERSKTLLDMYGDSAHPLAEAALIDDSVAGLIFRKRYGAAPDVSSTRVAQPEEMAPHFGANEEEEEEEAAKAKATEPATPLQPFEESRETPHKAPHKAPPVLSYPEAARRLLFFERLFYSLDEDCSLFLSADECALPPNHPLQWTSPSP